MIEPAGWQEPGDLGDRSELQREHLEAAAIAAARSGGRTVETTDCDWDTTGWTSSDIDDDTDLTDWTGYEHDLTDAEHQALHVISDLDDLDDDLEDFDLLGLNDADTGAW